MKRLFVDLGAGLGGASEAFMKQDGWEVLRFDNSDLVQDVEGMHQVDYVTSTDDVIDWIMDVVLIEDIEEVVIWASPECKQWSNGFNSEKCTIRRAGNIFVPNLEQVKAIAEIVNSIKPKFFILENVMGGVDFLNPIFGKPSLIYRPWFFWGWFPEFRIDEIRNHKTKNDVHSSNPLRYHLRSKIPIGISMSLKNAIENQTSLLEWVD